MMKQKYWLYGILILAVIGIVLISGCVQKEAPLDGGEEETEPPTEVQIYKGIWAPMIIFQDKDYLSSNLQELKDMGVNALFVLATPPFTEADFKEIEEILSLEVVEKVREILPVEKEVIINIIQTAHNNGLKVGLTMGNPPAPENVDLEAINSKIIEYAELAEEYDVELFAPMDEAEKIFPENIGEWRQEIIQKIKEVYHGDVVWKGAGVGLPSEPRTEENLRNLAESPPGDFAGYDYIGNGIMLSPEEYTLEEYSQYVEEVLKFYAALAERDGCKGLIISEFGVLDTGSTLSDEEVARAHEIVLEKASGHDDVFGLFAFQEFLGVQVSGSPVHFFEENIKTGEVIKRWYAES